MARPTLASISSLQAWDAPLNDNLAKLASAPIPIHESASLTEANLQSTFPAAAHDRCLVWVNHTVVGYTLYESDGTRWRPFGPRQPMRTNAGAITLGEADLFSRFTGTTATWGLAPVANMAGYEIVVKNDGSGNLTLDANASETIDGATTLVVASGDSVRLHCDGTEWWVVG